MRRFLALRLGALLARSRVLRMCFDFALRLLSSRQHVAAVAVIEDGAGRLLLARHPLRAMAPWGLPGGLVGPGETLEEAVVRELREELALEVGDLQPLGSWRDGWLLVAVFRCRALQVQEPRRLSWEVAEVRWCSVPEALMLLRAPLEREAVRLASGRPDPAPARSGRSGG